MASITVPCPKTVLVAGKVGSNAQNSQQRQRVSFPSALNTNQSLSFGSTSSGFQWANGKQFAATKVQAQLNEVVAEKSSNSAVVLDGKPKVEASETETELPESNIPDASSISAFMTQVSDLVKLVDSKDITELKLKQMGCELIIRKKEALQQPPPSAPATGMQPFYPQAMYPQPAAPAAAPAAPSPARTPAPALPPPAKASSSHPPLKCPMAGTFYRSPAPGEPAFVKVGDKVLKGQVICIIEAMKLMNDIEADQSGTITEILAEDGKPVSVDTPLFVIAP